MPSDYATGLACKVSGYSAGDDLGQRRPTARIDSGQLAIGGPENFPEARQAIAVLDQSTGQWVPAVAISPNEYARATDWGHNTLQYKIWKWRPVRVTDDDWRLASRTAAGRVVASATERLVSASNRPEGRGLLSRWFSSSGAMMARERREEDLEGV
jgi:hypothetical protein